MKNKNTISIVAFTFKFVVFNKFRKGVSITRINPKTLLTKKLGYRKMFFQKLFVILGD